MSKALTASVALNAHDELLINYRCEGCNGIHAFPLEAVEQILSNGELVYVDFSCQASNSVMRVNADWVKQALTKLGRNAQCLVRHNSALRVGMWQISTKTGETHPVLVDWSPAACELPTAA